MNELLEIRELNDRLHWWMQKCMTAIEPMECGHPGACFDHERNVCEWCESIKPKATRGKKARAYIQVLTEYQQHEFNKIWQAWPNKRDDGKPAKGDRFRAMEAFASAIHSGYSPEDLVLAGAKYLTTYREDRAGFLQQVATFYGPQKRTFMTYMEEQ